MGIKRSKATAGKPDGRGSQTPSRVLRQLGWDAGNLSGRTSRLGSGLEVDSRVATDAVCGAWRINQGDCAPIPTEPVPGSPGREFQSGTPMVPSSLVMA